MQPTWHTIPNGAVTSQSAELRRRSEPRPPQPRAALPTRRAGACARASSGGVSVPIPAGSCRTAGAGGSSATPHRMNYSESAARGKQSLTSIHISFLTTNLVSLNEDNVSSAILAVGSGIKSQELQDLRVITLVLGKPEPALVRLLILSRTCLSVPPSLGTQGIISLKDNADCLRPIWSGVFQEKWDQPREGKRRGARANTYIKEQS